MGREKTVKPPEHRRPVPLPPVCRNDIKFHDIAVARLYKAFVFRMIHLAVPKPHEGIAVVAELQMPVMRPLHAQDAARYVSQKFRIRMPALVTVEFPEVRNHQALEPPPVLLMAPPKLDKRQIVHVVPSFLLFGDMQNRP